MPKGRYFNVCIGQVQSIKLLTKQQQRYSPKHMQICRRHLTQSSYFFSQNINLLTTQNQQLTFNPPTLQHNRQHEYSYVHSLMRRRIKTIYVTLLKVTFELLDSMSDQVGSNVVGRCLIM